MRTIITEEIRSARQAPEPEVSEMHLGRAFLSIVGLISLAVEIEVLEQLDNVSRYMTYREIGFDLAFLLPILIVIATLWWGCVWLCAESASLVSFLKPHRARLFWLAGLAVPSAYVIFNCCDAAKLRLLSSWQPPRSAWLWASVPGVALCAITLLRVRTSTLQKFARTRLAPIGGLHLVAAVIAVLGLWNHGAYLFHNYVHPGVPAAQSQQPDVYLITFDALRADEMSVYGYTRPTTPALERFAQRSSTFDYFFANSNLTTPSTVSIETGKLPWSHRVYELGGFLRDKAQEENLAALLRQRGYYTAMIAANYLASPMQHRTLESYDAAEYAVSRDATGAWSLATSVIGLNTRDTVAVFLRRMGILRIWLDAFMWGDHYPYPPEDVFARARTLLLQRDEGQPKLIWMHLYAPHDPYLPPPEYRNRFLITDKLTDGYDFLGFGNRSLPPGASETELRARYDETILYADHALGGFLDWLEKTGRLDKSIVIVSSDHGEAFDHNWFGHRGPYLYNSLIRVPLLIHLPGQRSGSRITQVAQQADLLPTILDLVGGTVPTWTDGNSLKPVLLGNGLSDRPVFSMNLEPDRIFTSISKGTLAVINNDYKYIEYLGTHRQELYRYRTDPSEEHNLVTSDGAIAEQMRAELLKKLHTVNQPYSSVAENN